MHTIPYHIIPYHTIPHQYTIPNHTIPYHIPYPITSYHTITYCTIPYHTTPYYITPYHITPYHAIPYHTIPHTIPYHTVHTDIIPHWSRQWFVSYHTYITSHTLCFCNILAHAWNHFFLFCSKRDVKACISKIETVGYNEKLVSWITERVHTYCNCKINFVKWLACGIRFNWKS